MSTFSGTNSTKFTKESISVIKDNLPRNSYKQIAAETGLQYRYIAQLFNGKGYNKDVIFCALAIIKEHNQAIAEAEKQIAEL